MRCSLANRAGGGALDFRRPRCGQARFSVVATNQLVAVKQQVVEVVGVAGDAEGGAERGCEVPDGLMGWQPAPGWHIRHRAGTK